MNVLAKGCLTLLMVALGVLPAVILHAASLPALGGAAPPGDGGVATPPGREAEPETGDAPPAEPEGVPETPEPSWWDRTRRADDEDATTEALDEGEASDLEDGDGQQPTGSDDDLDDPMAEDNGAQPGTEEGAPTGTPEDEGLLGGLLGGGGD